MTVTNPVNRVADGATFPIDVWTTTVGSADDAQRLAQGMVQQRLAACVQIEPITSHYVWQGQLEASPEWRLSCKTLPTASAALHTWLRAHHPYSVPQWLVRTEHATADYAAWVAENVTVPPVHLTV